MSNTVNNLAEKEYLDQRKSSIDIITPESNIFRQWLNLRQEYMEKQGWSFGDDLDDYDADPDTVQLLSCDQGVIQAGMRLTPCEDIPSSKSWSWLPDSLLAQAEGNLPDPANGQVWDLTRLVTNENMKGASADTIVELFGAGLKSCLGHDDSPRWVFATTVEFYRYFQYRGVEFTPIARGKFSPGDKRDSILCYTDPKSIVAELAAKADAGMDDRIVSRAKKGMASVSIRNHLS